MSYSIETQKEVTISERETVEVSLVGYIGHMINKKRVEADINVSQLSRRLAARNHPISSTTLGNIEKGMTPLKVQDLAAIADYFDVKMGVFFPEGVV